MGCNLINLVALASGKHKMQHAAIPASAAEKLRAIGDFLWEVVERCLYESTWMRSSSLSKPSLTLPGQGQNRRWSRRLSAMALAGGRKL
jgi:hypothetical protein